MSNYDSRVYITNSRLPVFDYNTEESKKILADICGNIDITNELLTNIPTGLTVTDNRLLVDIGTSVSVSGEITVSNFPAIQTIDGSVNILNFPVNPEPIVYNLDYVSEAMYADSINGAFIDQYGRPGWFWSNGDSSGGSNAYWYSNTIVPQNQMTKGEMDCIYIILALDRVSPTIVLPFVPLYSLPTGSGDIVPGFAHSSWTYTIPSSHKLNAGEVVMLVIGSLEKVSSIHPNLRRIQLQLNSTAGQALDTEVIGLVSLNTDSGLKDIGAIQYLLQYAGFHYSVTDKVTEYEFNNGVQKVINNNLTKDGIKVIVQSLPPVEIVPGATIEVINFPATQEVTGTFWQTTQPVSGTVSVSSLPDISGSVNVSNFPTSTEVSNFPTSTEVSNFPTSTEVSNVVSVYDSNTLAINQKLTLAPGPNNDSILVFVKNSPTSFSVSGPVSITGPVGVTGTVSINNFPTSFSVSGPVGITGPVGVTGTVSIDNFPTSYSISGPVGITGPVGVTGTVSIDNFPTSYSISGPVGITGPVGVTGSVSVLNFPTSYSISGPVGITGPVGVTGSVNVLNFPTQTSISGPVGITGTVGITGSVAISNTSLETHDISLNAKIPQLTISGDALKCYLTNDIAVTVPHLSYTTDSVTVSGNVTVNSLTFRNSDLKTFDASLNAQLTAGISVTPADGSKIDSHLYASTNGNPNSVHILQAADNGRLYVRLSDGTHDSDVLADGRLTVFDSSVHEHVTSIDTKLSGTIQVKDVSQNYAGGRLLVNDISATTELSDINALLQIGVVTYGKADDVYTGYQIPFLTDASGIQKNYITNFPATQAVTLSGSPTVTISGQAVQVSNFPSTYPTTLSGSPTVTISGQTVQVTGQTVKSQTYDYQNNGITSTNHTVFKYGLDTTSALATTDMTTRYLLTSTADVTATKRGLDCNIINTALNIRDTSGTALTSTSNALNTFPKNTAYTTATATRLADASGFIGTTTGQLNVYDSTVNQTLGDIKMLTAQSTTFYPLSTALNQVQSYQGAYEIPTVIQYPSSKFHSISCATSTAGSRLLLTNSNEGVTQFTLNSFVPRAVGTAQSLYIVASGAGIIPTVRCNGITLAGDDIEFYVICNGTTNVTLGAIYQGGTLDVNLATDLRCIYSMKATTTTFSSGTIYARGLIGAITCTFVEMSTYYQQNPIYMCPNNTTAIFKGLTNSSATASDNYSTCVYRWNNNTSTYGVEFPWRFTIAVSVTQNSNYYSDGLLALFPNDILILNRESGTGAAASMKGIFEIKSLQ